MDIKGARKAWIVHRIFQKFGAFVRTKAREFCPREEFVSDVLSAMFDRIERGLDEKTVLQLDRMLEDDWRLREYAIPVLGGMEQVMERLLPPPVVRSAVRV